MPKVTVTAKESKNLAVKKSINGYGIFTTKSFKADTKLFEVTGPKVKCEEGDDMSEEERSNTFRFTKVWYINPKGRLGDMLNHSCEPNAKVIKTNDKLFIVSLVSLAKASEVLIDYSTILASDDSWTMVCRCESANCRKVIKKFKSLPKSKQEIYKKLQMVPRYIL
jgi:SET domain-containing protein